MIDKEFNNEINKQIKDIKFNVSAEALNYNFSYDIKNQLRNLRLEMVCSKHLDNLEELSISMIDRLKRFKEEMEKVPNAEVISEVIYDYLEIKNILNCGLEKDLWDEYIKQNVLGEYKEDQLLQLIHDQYLHSSFRMSMVDIIRMFLVNVEALNTYKSELLQECRKEKINLVYELALNYSIYNVFLEKIEALKNQALHDIENVFMNTNLQYTYLIEDKLDKIMINLESKLQDLFKNNVVFCIGNGAVDKRDNLIRIKNKKSNHNKKLSND